MKEKQNNNMLFIVIIVLLIIIAVLGFFLGKNMGNSSNVGINNSSVVAKDLEITVIDDKRCADCQTEQIVSQLQQVPSLADANFEVKDFSEIDDALKNSGIQYIPSIIFSHNDVENELKQYLVKLTSGEYSLQVGATFDPFKERSERGFLILDKNQISEIIDKSYIKGSPNAQITWIEYTDLNCSFCQKMQKDGTAEKVLNNFPEELNKATSNFIGVGGELTRTGAEILECVGKIGGAEKYNDVMGEILSSGNTGKSLILGIVEEKGLDKNQIEKCYDNGETKELVEEKFMQGVDIFGISGTPGNVLINNETGEYEILSGALPSENFISAIDRLLLK